MSVGIERIVMEQGSLVVQELVSQAVNVGLDVTRRFAMSRKGVILNAYGYR